MRSRYVPHPREPWRHGTENGYQNHRCRCPACTDAHRVYYRNKVKGVCPECGGTVSNRFQSKLCDPCHRRHVTIVEHGTTAMYGRGCRCDLCRAASSAARKQRRHNQKRKEAA
jgi:hypothetical protein